MEKTKSEVEQYINFIEQSIDPAAAKIKTIGDLILVDIFLVKPEKRKSNIERPGAVSETELGYMWYPVARVLSESEFGIPVGTFVRLLDSKVCVFTNPKYEEWQSLSSKGNIEKLGVQPPQLICRFYEKFQTYTFSLYPVKNVESKHNAFCIPKFEIAAILKDPYAIIPA